MLNRRQEVLLAFLAAPRGSFSLDQVRVMKGMFLLSRKGAVLEHAYDFRAYDYGAFDATVYRDLDTLAAEGLVQVSSIGERRRRYDTTEAGKVLGDSLLQGKLSESRLEIERAAVRLTSKSFEAMLNDVYDEHPDFAEKSVLRNRVPA